MIRTKPNRGIDFSRSGIYINSVLCYEEKPWSNLCIYSKVYSKVRLCDKNEIHNIYPLPDHVLHLLVEGKQIGEKMIISKKNFDKALAEREKQIFEKMDMSRVEREKNRYLNERIDELERLVHRMSDELDMLLDIKKKYEEVCVTAPQRRW